MSRYQPINNSNGTSLGSYKNITIPSANIQGNPTTSFNPPNSSQYGPRMYAEGSSASDIYGGGPAVYGERGNVYTIGRHASVPLYANSPQSIDPIPLDPAIGDNLTPHKQIEYEPYETLDANGMPLPGLQKSDTHLKLIVVIIIILFPISIKLTAEAIQGFISQKMYDGVALTPKQLLITAACIFGAVLLLYNYIAADIFNEISQKFFDPLKTIINK